MTKRVSEMTEEEHDKLLETDRRYRAENPEKVRENGHIYYVENRDKVLETNRRWATENPEKVREKSRRWATKNRDKINEGGRKRLQDLKQKALDLLGGECVICGYKEDIDGFELDHINNDGKKWRKEVLGGQKGSGTLYSWILRNPEEAHIVFQVLCGTHHRIKTVRESRNRGKTRNRMDEIEH